MSHLPPDVPGPGALAPGIVATAAEVLAHLPDPTVLIDGVGTLRWANVAADRVMGSAVADLLGGSAMDLVHPDDLTTALLSLDSVQGKESGTPVEIRVRTEHGWKLAEVVGAPVPDGLVALTLRDLTQRRRWELASDDAAELRALVHHAPALLVLLDRRGSVQATSGAITRILGHGQEALEGAGFVDVVEPEDRAQWDDALARAVRDGADRLDPVRVEIRLLDRHRGESAPFDLAIVNLLDDPTVEGLMVTGLDVRERSAVELELRNMLSVLHATLESTADGILVVSLDGTITSHNQRFADMWQLPTEVIATGHLQAVMAHVADQLDDPDGVLAATRERHGDHELSSADEVHFSDGRVFERSSRPQRIDGQVVGRVWSFHDVTRQKQLEAELEHQAFHDSLTGLANQALFRERIGASLARAVRTGEQVAVVYFDLDDFKRVNDSLGHPVGDRLLLAVAERLTSCVRPTDLAARLGGDEFGVVIEAVDAEAQARVVADRIVDRLRAPVSLGTRSIVTSVSVGVAASTPGLSAEQLLRNADLAMYAAKRTGKARAEVYAADMHVVALARLEIEADLRASDIASEFFLVYQPIVELVTGRITGVEALVRWRHPRRGILTPDQFIRAAEDLGLIGRVGAHVLDEAADQARRWNDAGRVLSMSVNVSALQLTGGGFVDQVGAVLERTGLEPGQLLLEVTETAMLHDTSMVVESFDGMRAMGVRLALDDFGTGYSSLTHLQRFPIDVIKIDRSFIDHAQDDPALVRAVVGLARELGMDAVAEGVETPQQVALLVEAGCKLGQGYFFARPGPPDTLDVARSSTRRDPLG